MRSFGRARFQTGRLGQAEAFGLVRYRSHRDSIQMSTLCAVRVGCPLALLRISMWFVFLQSEPTEAAIHPMWSNDATGESREFIGPC